MRRLKRGGGWAAVPYTLRMANRVGWGRLWKAMTARNACKICALGICGQRGGMRNGAGHWPEACKNSLQAMVADMQEGLRSEFFQRYSIDQLRTLTPRELEWCGRLTQPVHAGPGDTHYRVIGWDEALGRAADNLKNHPPNQTFYYASGRSSNEAGFLLQLFARVYGTNYVNNCSYYCHQASGVGLSGSVGTGTATVTLDDVEHTDLFFLIGGNPASNHPRMMRTLMNIRRRGGHIVVVNPVKEIGLVNFSVPSDLWSLLFGSKIAHLYVQPHIGGDIALLTGVAKLVLERGAADRGFIAEATEGFDEYERLVRAASWEEIEKGSGVARSEFEKIADSYCRAKSAVFGWTMGITHHEHGVANVRSIVNPGGLRRGAGRMIRMVLDQRVRMPSSMMRRCAFPRAAVVVAALLAASCRPGDRKPVFPVSGSIYFQGRAAEGVRVAFHPSRDPQDHGLCPQAVVAADGSFHLTTYSAGDGAPQGEYAVTLYWPAPGADDDVHVRPDRLGGRYADVRTTPLAKTIPARAVSLDRFDLN